MIAALFDCDGTLYSARFGRGLSKYAAEHGRKGAIRAYYAGLLPQYILHALKLMDDEAYLRPVIAHLAWLIKGWDEPHGRAAMDWVTHEYLLPTLRPDVIARLRGHQAQGHQVVLISAMFLPSLEQVARHLNVAGFVGTQVEIKAGVYTGGIVPPVITGVDKESSTRRYFSERSLDIDWKSSYAYADSITDQGLFGLVGHPIAVYPDSKLLKLAQAREWEIIGRRD